MLIHNVKLIDFDLFYREQIHNTIMDSIYAYGLFKDGKIDLHKREVKQIFNNFVSYYILKHKPTDPNIKEVFVIFPKILKEDSDVGNYSHIRISEYVDLACLRKCLKPTIRSMYGLRPDLIFLGKRDASLTNPDLISQVFHSANQYKI